LRYLLSMTYRHGTAVHPSLSISTHHAPVNATFAVKALMLVGGHERLCPFCCQQVVLHAIREYDLARRT
jgi:hypothetical protein